MGLFCKVMERCGRAVGPENEAAYDAAMAAAGRSTGGQAGQNKSASAGGKEDCWGFLSLEDEDALSSEQHATILAYSEEKQKDATEVTWSAVSADGAAKWIAKAKEMELSAMSRPKVFPVLEKRGKSKKVVSLEETKDIF